MIKLCKYCNKQLENATFDYCNKKCWRLFNKFPENCVICDKELTYQRKCCSSSCLGKLRRSNVKKIEKKQVIVLLSDRHCKHCNKQLTYQTSYCSHSCRAKAVNNFNTEKSIRKRSITHTGMLHKSTIEKLKIKRYCENPKCKKELTLKQKRFCSISCNVTITSIGRKKPKKEIERLRIAWTGKNNPLYGKPPYYRKYPYKNYIMRSSWEVKYAKWLDSKNIKWKYEEYPFDLGNCTYTLDFFIYDDNENLIQLIDVKGRETEMWKTKFELYKQIYKNEFKITKILYKKDLIEIGAW